MAFSNLKEIEVPITSFVDLVTAVSFFKKVPEDSLWVGSVCERMSWEQYKKCSFLQIYPIDIGGKLVQQGLFNFKNMVPI